MAYILVGICWKISQTIFAHSKKNQWLFFHGNRIKTIMHLHYRKKHTNYTH